ncbi:hypothetical protein XELAEV_18032479mg [Xenopus laevis]|uniref:Uncharacterized protein n=1 Tax=Xenopus laevis TaxID=8355 RepID=A0A974CRH0_XENLA|nr:hypothetical protein XELAEV_18032479mg [Xenopus laevis]
MNCISSVSFQVINFFLPEFNVARNEGIEIPTLCFPLCCLFLIRMKCIVVLLVCISIGRAHFCKPKKGDKLSICYMMSLRCRTITDISQKTITLFCHGMVGQYVTVSIPDREETLQLCEVEVYGQVVRAVVPAH